MNRTLLNPDTGPDRPVFHGEPVEDVYLDDDTDYVDDVSTGEPDMEDSPAWSVDTGVGEVTAPVNSPDIAP